MTTTEVSSSSPEPEKRQMIDRVRQWVILSCGVVLILYSLGDNTAPAAFMIGCSMVGGVPLDLAFAGTRSRNDNS